jgi:hypothetical protein
MEHTTIEMLEKHEEIIIFRTHTYAQVPAAAAGTVVGKKATQIKRFRVVCSHASSLLCPTV